MSFSLHWISEDWTTASRKLCDGFFAHFAFERSVDKSDEHPWLPTYTVQHQLARLEKRRFLLARLDDAPR